LFFNTKIFLIIEERKKREKEKEKKKRLPTKDYYLE